MEGLCGRDLVLWSAAEAPWFTLADLLSDGVEPEDVFARGPR